MYLLAFAVILCLFLLVMTMYVYVGNKRLITRVQKEVNDGIKLIDPDPDPDTGPRNDTLMEAHTICKTCDVYVDVYNKYRYFADAFKCGTVLMCIMNSRYKIREC